MSEAAAIADVARDLVEMRRVAEAIDMLDAELPNRHDRDCPACGAHGQFVQTPIIETSNRVIAGAPCRESGLVACRLCNTGGVTLTSDLGDDDEFPFLEPIPGPCSACHGRGWVDGMREMIVPHESRLLARRKP